MNHIVGNVAPGFVGRQRGRWVLVGHIFGKKKVEGGLSTIKISLGTLKG